MEAAKKLNPSESSDSIRLQKVAQTKSLLYVVLFMSTDISTKVLTISECPDCTSGKLRDSSGRH